MTGRQPHDLVFGPYAQRRVGVLQFAGAFDHVPCGLVERVLQGGFEPPAFGDLDQRPQVRLDHAGERLQSLAEQQRVVVALGVGARMRAGLRASNRRARHLPMRYETGLPSSVIRFRT